ncbi:MAG: 2-hydroxyacyl-CoA dehydratase [Spirochaetes bacterium]|nr:2-hydroxyacyl-CoA dehydratase [Spirochaetota bacterium]
MDLAPYQVLDSTIRGWENAVKELEHPYRVYLYFRYVLHRKLFHETEQNKNLRYGFMSAGGGLSTPKELQGQLHICHAFLESSGAARADEKEGKPVIWHDWPVPASIIRAFDAASFPPLLFMLISQSKGGAPVDLELEACDDEGITDDMCTFNRIGLGAYLLEQIPGPSAMISITHPCDSTRSSNQLLDYYTGPEVPFYVLDTPYGRDEDSASYFRDNLMGMVRFLEKHLGRPISWDRLKRSAEEINTFNHYMREATLLHRAIPSPGLLLLMSGAWVANICSPGSKHLSETAKIIYEIARSRVSGIQFFRKRKEKIRVITADPMVIFTELFMWMRKEFGAIVVSDYIGNVVAPEIDTSTEESLLKGIGLDRLNMGMIRQSHGMANFNTDELTGAIEDYSGDCVILFGHMGCKHNQAIHRIIKDTCRKAGVPALLLECDIANRKVTSEDELKRQISDFFIRNGLA